MNKPMRKKLIETALPLEAINEAAAREKSIRDGHPSTLHLYWARRPLAACRAVLFASFVDDPGEPDCPPELLKLIDKLPNPTLVDRQKLNKQGKPEWCDRSELVYRPKYTAEQIADMEANHLAELRRQKLFSFLSELVQWYASDDEALLTTARELIHAACGGNPPPVLDPFCGGGSIPIEAQRLGLRALGSDLNPLAVLITKAMVELPAKFQNVPPISTQHTQKKRLVEGEWKGARGLAEDIRFYGEWMRNEAFRRIGHLYPTVKITAGMAKDRADLKPYVGRELTVIAWLWARTVPSPDPSARGAHVPLVRSFELSRKAGRAVWVEPIVDRSTMRYRFVVRVSKSAPTGTEGTYTARRGAVCVLTGSSIAMNYLREACAAAKASATLLAIVAEGARERVYIAPASEHSESAKVEFKGFRPDATMPDNPRWFSPPAYGLKTYGSLFTDRQLVALTTFSDLVKEARDRAEADALRLKWPAERARAYADHLAVYLAFTVSKCADYHSSISTWSAKGEFIRGTFARQAIPMTWDFTECNPFSDATGNFNAACEWVWKVVKALPSGIAAGTVVQADARTSSHRPHTVFATDPPYYDNIGYADLSDFFYVWLKRSLGPVDPDLVPYLATPKEDELIATPYRHGGSKLRAKEFFEKGLREVFAGFAQNQVPDVPVTVFYAFKQTENEDEGDPADSAQDSTASTGWETMLQGLVDSGLMVTATWPMRTERPGKITMNTNILASSIVLACRPRPQNARKIRRADFRSELKRELAAALDVMRQGTVSPVDFAQAAIGPGMAIYSRYSAVEELDGSAMRVRSALVLINEVLAEVVEPVDADPETRWAIKWYTQHGWKEGPFDDAAIFARSLGVGVDALQRAGIIRASGGRAKLLDRAELNPDYDPANDPKTTVWEVVQYLIRELQERGVDAAGRMLRRFRESKASLEPDRARDLCYTLFTLCDRKGWAKDAGPYNALAQEWEEIDKASKRDSSRWDSGKLDV